VTAVWALLPLLALAVGIALAVPYERRERRRHADRQFAARLARLGAQFDELAASLREAMLPALADFAKAVATLTTVMKGDRA